MVPNSIIGDRSAESRIKVSVAIPAYNAASTIQATVDSVLRQTVRPFEILVLNDGSTDDTSALLKRYEPQVTVIHRKNRGVAAARCTLCDLARGDLLAFLDADDVWHPRYLEVQSKLFAEHPEAVAFFTGHTNFRGYGNYEWGTAPLSALPPVELIDSFSFLRRYGESTGDFACLTYCCIPKRVFAEVGSERFRLSGVEDSFFLTVLPLLGRPVLYCPIPLAAYRVTGESLSANRLRTYALWVDVYRLLEERYQKEAHETLMKAFRIAFASRRRQYAKLLMTAGRVSEARTELLRSLNNSHDARSMARSLGLLIGSYAPSSLQPKWRPIARSSEGK
jgi:glycosyltransferase involved in cell wall biosynthesis